MAMIVQHNLAAMNTNRQLGISTSALAKSTEKLSSGYPQSRLGYCHGRHLFLYRWLPVLQVLSFSAK